VLVLDGTKIDYERQHECLRLSYPADIPSHARYPPHP
jgi:hypothetical protein